jgi:chemotaxis protein CheD
MVASIVGIADCKVSKSPGDVLITHALGSCIAVIIHDPVAKVAGLLHYMLPDSSLDPDKAIKRPYVFADSGIPLLFQTAYQLGGVKSRMVVMVAGGAQMLDRNGTFDIGKRNYLAMRRIFQTAGVNVHKEAVGGTRSRTVWIEVDSGRVQLRLAGEDEQDRKVNSKRNGGCGGLQHTHCG